MADPNISHIHTAFAIIAIDLSQKFVALLVINKRKIGKWITFEPTVVVKDGQIFVKNSKAIRYSIDNILQMLRQKDIFDIAEVQLAIIESSGDISVQKKTEKSTPPIEDLGITKKSSGISYPVIIEGVMCEEVLKDLQLTKEALRKRLQDEGLIRIDSIFLCRINNEGNLHLTYTRKDERIERIPH